MSLSKFEVDVSQLIFLVPMIKMKIKSPEVLMGRLVDTHALIDKIVADGKINEADLPIVIAMILGSPSAPKPAPVPPVIVVPAPTPTPGPSPAGRLFGLTCWVEEFWHDWFKGTLPGEPNSDWAPGGSEMATKILNGEAALPPSGVARFMCEELPVGSHKMGAFVIEHVFNLDGKEYIVRSDSNEDDQPFGELAHVVRGPRWRAGMGWDVMVKFKDWDGPKQLSYFTRSAEDPTIVFQGRRPTFTIAGRKH